MDYATPPDDNAYYREPAMVPQNTAGGAQTRTRCDSDSTSTPGHLEHERDLSHYRVRLKQIYKTGFLLNLCCRTVECTCFRPSSNFSVCADGAGR
jgi:hypothetical protein